MEDAKGGPGDPTESVGPRKRGLGRGLGAILSAHGRVEAHAAQLDPLTGLPNRLLLEDRLEDALDRCREDEASLAVLVVSLDNFTNVNELFGHRVGDDLLSETADRLSAARRKMDTVARFAGDEFVVVCPYVGSAELACFVAERLLEDIGRPITIDDVEHRLSASVGIVLVEPEQPGGAEEAGRAGGSPGAAAGASAGAPADGETGREGGHEAVTWHGSETVESLLGDASLAMRHAKDEGGGSWKLFEPSMRTDADVRFHSRQELHSALEDGGLALHYEPIVDLGRGLVVGECVIPGWAAPTEDDDGHELLDLVDEAGLGAPICRWMLDEALSELGTRRAADLPEGFRMWVKVAPSMSGDAALVDAIDELSSKHGVPTSMLGIDVREPQAPVLSAVEPVLQALEDRDVATAFDDFGMQPSNLALLPSLPVSALKLSPALVSATAGPDGDAGLHEDDEDDEGVGQALVRGIVDLGRAIGLRVVAQGVVSARQASTLAALGCELAQGTFLVPAPASPALAAPAPAAPASSSSAGRSPATGASAVEPAPSRALEPSPSGAIEPSPPPRAAPDRDALWATAPPAPAAGVAGPGSAGAPVGRGDAPTRGAPGAAVFVPDAPAAAAPLEATVSRLPVVTPQDVDVTGHPSHTSRLAATSEEQGGDPHTGGAPADPAERDHAQSGPDAPGNLPGEQPNADPPPAEHGGPLFVV